MKISKSKRQLAQLLIKAGVKQLPEGSNWAAQDKTGTICLYAVKPTRDDKHVYWGCNGSDCEMYRYYADLPIQGWHQTCLNRAEFDQIVAESAEQSKPDEGGWIEWKGGECPVPTGVSVDVRYRGGRTEYNLPANRCVRGRGYDASKPFWINDGYHSDIIAYRLHKPKQMPPYNLQEAINCRCVVTTAQTANLDQLLQDYRNASDFAATKQAEADEAAKMRDERWRAAQARACELGVHISVELVVDAEMRESELVITDWRDLRVGDVIRCIGNWQGEDTDGKEFKITHLEYPEYDGRMPIQIYVPGVPVPLTWGGEFHFIRRP